jgi:spore germination cell wall hydrolase CwlJ-like protein
LFAFQIQLAAAQNKLELIAATLVLEAQNQGEIGMQAVYEVLRNRAKSSKIEKIYLEARRPKQFSCLNNISDSNAIARARKSIAWPVAVKLIKSNPKSNLVKGACHYYADWMRTPPVWAKGKNKIKIGNHFFLVGIK